MSEHHRWSTRFKAKLFRRSSISSKFHKPSTTSNPSSSTPDIHHQHQGDTGTVKGEQAAEELPSAHPNFRSTTTTPITPITPTTPTSTNPNTLPSQPPQPAPSSASRPSTYSFVDCQLTPDELASAPASIGGHDYFVPEDRSPTASSHTQRHPEPLDDPVNQTSSATSTTSRLQPQPQDPQQLRHSARRRPHDRDRARLDASNRRSLPPELHHFPLPPSAKTEQASPVSSPLPAPKAHRSSVPTSLHPGAERITPAHTEFQSQAALNAVEEDPSREPSITSYSFPLPPTSVSKRPSLGGRRQSLLPASHQHLVSSVLDTGSFPEHDESGNQHYSTMGSGMVPRKIWVKRPGGSATLVPTREDTVVDELRDMVVAKYANSLGRTFDPPDIIIRITAREGPLRQSTPDRILSPEEPVCPLLDSYYPGGQTIEDALVIEIPQRRTPKPSPRHNVYYTHSEPGEHGEYFPLIPANGMASSPQTHASNASTGHAPSISILTTGMAPALPSPGSRGSRHARRPPLTRHATQSPTVPGQVSYSKDHTSAQSTAPSQPTPSIPTPPGPHPESPQTKALTPPARGASPRPHPTTHAAKPNLSSTSPSGSTFSGLIEGIVPPINVLIVEDNNINQRLLEAFMKKLKVRWDCAGNGQEAVNKWRQGGFHLVLMDIQLPVMNGLDATKEIRRLERVNGIGFLPKKESGSSSAEADSPAPTGPLTEADTLHDLSLFKSPVIIVALTASSLQSDRHEALTAGCNDFLTKPVRFNWLEKKVTEWGCMQALIDVEGWRKWRGFSNDLSSNSSDRTNPLQRRSDGASLKHSPADSSPASTARKLEGNSPRLQKHTDLVDDSPDSVSGDGSDSPASLHAPPV